MLGYALVREGSDNSLPAGGTDGQVLTKASNADYDVEWTTVESGGGGYYVDFTTTGVKATSATTDVTIEDITDAINSGKTVIARVNVEGSQYNEPFTVFLPLITYYDLNGLLPPLFGTVMLMYTPSASVLNIRYVELTADFENGPITWSFNYNDWVVDLTNT